MSELQIGVARQPARGMRRERPGYPLPRVRFVTGLALVVALAMATVGIQAYMRADRQQARIVALQAHLAGLERRVAADERAAAGERGRVRSVAAQASGARRAVARVSWALQSVPSQAQLAGVRNALTTYAACMPQLQREIAGLHLGWRIEAAKPSTDSFRLSTAAPLSPSCRTLLNRG